MTEVEVILAALAAGAGAGSAAVAQSAVVDAYSGLRDRIRRALARQGHADGAIDSVETEPEAWRTRVCETLVGSGVDQDSEVLAAAAALLTLADPAGAAAGRYQVDARGATGVQAGDGTVHVDTNYGVAAGTMTAPVNITYGQVPFPPAAPEA